MFEEPAPAAENIPGLMPAGEMPSDAGFADMTGRDGISLQALWGETVSFQAACRVVIASEKSCGKLCSGRMRLQIGNVPEGIHVRIRQVLPVMCRKSRNQSAYDEDYLFRGDRMAPDILRDVGEEGIPVKSGVWQSLWVDLCPVGSPDFPEEMNGHLKNHLSRTAEMDLNLEARLHMGTCRDTEASSGTETDRIDLIKSAKVHLQVIPQKLPPLGIPHTEWFHYDAIVDYYGVPAFSEEFWRILGNFLEVYVKRGGNTILTPILTPPLDTAVGLERTTIQLVEVTAADGGYQMDFSKMEKFLDICLEKGIIYFEICHLFTQWGAEAAPKVEAWVDGKKQRIFGWETPSDDPEYLRFLSCLLPQVKELMRRRGLLQNTFFHISDEPNFSSVHYQKAQKTVRRLLDGCTIIEAVSDYQCYEKGLVDIPVCSVDHIEPFLQKRPQRLWTYYCCAQMKDVPNRFIALPSFRNRVYGVLLYWHRIDGFLHWGFNFYNSECSRTHIDPYETADGNRSYPAGDPFLVYPGAGGVPEESLRLMVQEEGINDYRALCLLETYIGRKQVMELIRQEAGMELAFWRYPRNGYFLPRLRKRVNDLLEQMDSLPGQMNKPAERVDSLPK